WRQFNSSKQAQGELFFKPMVDHPVDNYFELLRSAYERNADGYFWVNFGRYTFTYDPNQADPVHVGYEFEGGDIRVVDGVVLQRQSRQISADSMMSDIDWPTTCVAKRGDFEMGGLDGMHIEHGRGDISLIVNTDSMKFVSLFLHRNLKIDSVYCNGQPVDYYRRRDFIFFGVILPQYAHRGDTLKLSVWYKGFNFTYSLPYVENPVSVLHTLTLRYPSGYNYLVPDWGKTETQGKNEVMTIESSRPYSKYLFQGFASGYDTTTLAASMGSTINILRPTHYTSVGNKLYEDASLKATNYFIDHFGAPPGAFETFIFPEGIALHMPGLVYLPWQPSIHDELGGFHLVASQAIATQWLGGAAQPASDRETWLTYAVPGYLALMALQANLGSEVFYTNMLSQRNALYTVSERGRDMPLAVGSRALPTTLNSKGVWVLHMLRWLMFDLKNHSDDQFMKFLHELIITMNSRTFTNYDFTRLAEKYCSTDLDNFFKYWLYGTGIPQYDVNYSIQAKDGQYYMNVTVHTSGVDEQFSMPVIMLVTEGGRSTFVQQPIKGSHTTFRLGPFAARPDRLYFNHFYSVLSKDNVTGL
ncbi:MAG TPA: hypothetical protein VMS71_08495, partial [Candidatus Acidoferrum sp.]|nr:hypothetical protein [Candidatus Acidoferrum sp.]